eukprot:221316_1
MRISNQTMTVTILFICCVIIVHLLNINSDLFYNQMVHSLTAIPFKTRHIPDPFTTRTIAVDQYQHDDFYNFLKRCLEKKHINETNFIRFSVGNYVYWQYIDHFFDEEINTDIFKKYTNLIQFIFCIDSKCLNFCQKRNYNCYYPLNKFQNDETILSVYHNSNTYTGVQTQKNSEITWGSSAMNTIGAMKYYLVYKILNLTNIYKKKPIIISSTDMDLFFKQHFIQYNFDKFLNQTINSNYSVVFQSEHGTLNTGTDINIGLQFWFSNYNNKNNLANEISLKLFEEITTNTTEWDQAVTQTFFTTNLKYEMYLKTCEFNKTGLPAHRIWFGEPMWKRKQFKIGEKKNVWKKYYKYYNEDRLLFHSTCMPNSWNKIFIAKCFGFYHSKYYYKQNIISFDEFLYQPWKQNEFYIIDINIFKYKFTKYY